MDWTDVVAGRLRRKNQVLFAKDDAFLQELAFQLRIQDRRVLVLWALDLAEDAVKALERQYPEQREPRDAWAAAGDWAAGRIRMPQARRAILACHAMARDLPAPEDAARCHAVGQACSVVHTAGHAMGFPVYELTALVRETGLPACRQAVESRWLEYLCRLARWREEAPWRQGPWAEFLLRDAPGKKPRQKTGFPPVFSGQGRV